MTPILRGMGYGQLDIVHSIVYISQKVGRKISVAILTLSFRNIAPKMLRSMIFGYIKANNNKNKSYFRGARGLFVNF